MRTPDITAYEFNAQALATVSAHVMNRNYLTVTRSGRKAHAYAISGDKTTTFGRAA